MKSIRIHPISGFMDRRSNPEDTPVGGWRHCLNFGVVQKLKVCRSSGWTKLLDRTPYEANFDFHDQLESISGVEGRRPLTFLFEATSASKSKTLIVGHDRTLFSLNVGTGNYRVLNSVPMGVDDLTRWYGTQNGDTVVFSNDYEQPVYWAFDSSAVAEIEDLTTLGISRAGVVVTWNGVTFFMNLVEKGAAKTYKMIWSDLDKPLSLIPGDDSIANSIELGFDESILAAAPLGNQLLIYTTKRIWQLGFAGGDPVFSVAKRYDPESSEACLAYKNSLISKGDEHIYSSRTGIYSYSLFHDKPVLIEYVNRSSSYIYDTLDEVKCDWFIGHYNPDRREVYFSWVNQGDELPVSTYVINTEFAFTGIVDHGFTAFCVFQSAPVTTLKQWILDECICDSEEFAEFFGEPENEGVPCVEPEPVVCESQPDSFFTTVTQELEDGIIMEDWNEEEPSENSLCNRLAGTTISSLCVDEARRDQCNAGRVFVMASAGDLCLKQLSESFYREVCTSFTGCGTYALVGYKSILRSGPLSFKDVANEKLLSRVLVEAVASASAEPGQMAIRIGTSSMSLDPNDPDCGILWFTENPITLDCIAVAASTHEADKTRPDGDLSFPTHVEGQWLFFELTVENANSTPIDTGASICLSSIVCDVDAKQRRY